MSSCYTDIFGNCPCDNGVMCDKCTYEDVKIVNLYEEEKEEAKKMNGSAITIIATWDGKFYETTEPIEFGKDGILVYDTKSATYEMMPYSNVNKTWVKGRKVSL